jgi:hypothetical protein
MNLKEFLLTQAKKAGVADDAEFNLMISASSLSDIEVPTAVIGKFDNNLFSLDIAKANINLKNHFISDFMMGYDEELVKMSKEYGLTPETVEEIKSTKSSGQKVKMAMKALKDLEEKARTANPNQSEEFVRKIAEAQDKLDSAVAKAEAEKHAIESKFVSKMQDLWEKAQLSNISWNDNIPEAARLPTYKSVVSDKLNSLGGKMVFDADANTSRLVNVNDEKLPLVVNGKEFGYSDLQALVLQENKLLREPGNGGSTTGTQGTQFQTPTYSGSGTTPQLPSYVSGALADISRIASNLGDNS